MSARKVAVCVVLSTLCLIALSSFILFGYIRHMKARLLSQTDHEALLVACRELSEHAEESGMRGVYQVRFNRGDGIVSKFPKPILDLDLSYVLIRSDGSITLEMVGGLAHFGVNAYPEGFKEPTLGFSHGDRKLLDGLWYYDDGEN